MMAEGDEYLDYPNEILESMVKFWSAEFVRGLMKWLLNSPFKANVWIVFFQVTNIRMMNFREYGIISMQYSPELDWRPDK